jgi:hypothetical protein
MGHLSLLGIRCIRRALAGAAAVALAAPASGAIVPGTSTRLIQVSADIGSGTLTDSASPAGPGLFDAVKQVEASQIDPPQKLARGTARQTSEFDATVISASGEAQTTLALDATTLAPNQVAATARSSFVLEFALDVLSIYTLIGTVDNSAVVQGGASLPTLANGVLFEALDTSTTLFETLTDDEAFSLSGTLGPGSYRITAFADSQALQMSGALFRSVTGNNTFNLVFEATPVGVPVSEPAVPSLLVAAALAAALSRRRACSAPAGRPRLDPSAPPESRWRW